MKRKTESYYKHQFKDKAGFTNKHHLKPKSKGGKKCPENLLSIDVYRHQAWHLLFGNKTLDEIIDLLIRTRDIKRNLK